jgi:hypothetical protein
LEELLLNSNNVVYPEYIGKYLYYFTAENAFDGLCDNIGSCGGNCGPSPETNPETETEGGNPVSPTT